MKDKGAKEAQKFQEQNHRILGGALLTSFIIINNPEK